VSNEWQAGEVGRALGTFQALVSDLPAERLADTLEGFHVTPLYLRHYDEVLERRGARGSPEVDRCLRSVAERRDRVQVLEDARSQGRLLLRPIHGDPKVDNVLFDDATGRAVCLIDLDTVKPGLVHYDVGDCLRSGCNPLGEETERWQEVRFEADLCRALLGGYLPAAGTFLTEWDYEYLYDAVRLIAFELGLRFFTDHLEGDVYFRVGRPDHNLTRALVQFRLAESIEALEPAIRAIVRDLRSSAGAGPGGPRR
jgi:Ser/Thr protein kinase RdoA (MazF antagonist)